MNSSCFHSCAYFFTHMQNIYMLVYVCVCVSIQREREIRQDSRGGGIISKKLGSVEKSE